MAPNAAPGPQPRLGQREAVGVVGQSDRYGERGLEVALEGLADQAGGVAVLHGAVLRVEYAGRANSESRRRCTGFRAHGLYQFDDPLDYMPIAFFSSGGEADAVEGVECCGRAEDHAFDFGAPQVDAPVLFGHTAFLRTIDGSL